MHMLFRRLLSLIEKIIPNRDIIASKKLWDKLANKNYLYYIVSKKGKDITNKQFRSTGLENYTEIIKNDSLLLDKLKAYYNKRVLEIGCGIGRMTEFFANDFKTVDGIDISESMIEQGKKYLAHLKNVNLIATDGINYPFQDDSFDLVFSYIVFQHMPSQEVVKANLREVFRVLNPNGGIAKIQLRGGVKPCKWKWYYGPSFSLNEAKSIINEIGFRLLKTEGENTKRFWLWLEK